MPYHSAFNKIYASGVESRVPVRLPQVAEALEYLSGRRHTHKDIAARNCLITSKLQVKLAAPALTRDAYQAEYCTYRNQVGGAAK